MNSNNTHTPRPAQQPAPAEGTRTALPAVTVEDLDPVALEAPTHREPASSTTVRRDHIARTIRTIRHHADRVGSRTLEAKWVLLDLMIGIHHLADWLGLPFDELVASARGYAHNASPTYLDQADHVWQLDPNASADLDTVVNKLLVPDLGADELALVLRAAIGLRQHGAGATAQCLDTALIWLRR